MAILSLGKGVRGCTPFEYNTYYDQVVYLKCQTCEYEWAMQLDSYKSNPPTICPLCNEPTISAFWIKHDARLFEYKYFKVVM